MSNKPFDRYNPLDRWPITELELGDRFGTIRGPSAMCMSMQSHAHVRQLADEVAAAVRAEFEQRAAPQEPTAPDTERLDWPVAWLLVSPNGKPMLCAMYKDEWSTEYPAGMVKPLYLGASSLGPDQVPK